MDFLGKRLERNDSVKTVGVELSQLLDIAQAILRTYEHAVPVQHIGKTDRVLEP